MFDTGSLISSALPLLVVVLAILSLALSPKARTMEMFFSGHTAAGRQPTLWTLTLSQVTTWIFARSLLNAAILGYYYGFWGTLAYAAYYLSFLTGGAIVDSLRFRHGYHNVQSFLTDRFGSFGQHGYNLVIALRLISEVFANILVIGILFGAAGSLEYGIAVALFAGITLTYSMLGGLHASLRTDVAQMIVFLVVLGLLVFMVASDGLFTADNLFFKPFDVSAPGPILLAVALLQVWSYPLHDPVMMDRGFLADRETTRRSFIHAAWLSSLCILLFGSLGIIAGAHAASGESMNAVLERLLGENLMFFFNAALVVSAMSTLDSTLSSSAKLVAVDMRLMQPTLRSGRMVMAVFMLLGLGFVFWGNNDLFSAVAVSGTASMYLAPVIFFCIWGGRKDVPHWSYATSFVIAVGGAILYFTESSGYSAVLGEWHKYTKLLMISLVVLIGGCLAFWIGILSRRQSLPLQEAPA